MDADLVPDPIPAWDVLARLAARPRGREIRHLFAADPSRAEAFSVSACGITLDISKTAIDATARDALLALAEAAGLREFRERLFAGAAVNVTEGRAAMHMALRAPAGTPLNAVLPTGVDDAAAVAAAERQRMRTFVSAVHDGTICGASGVRFTDVLNIGIGGSDLGPRMVCASLAEGGPMRAHFLSNVDGHAFAALVRELDPERTLVLIASKTFTTQETLINALAVREWLAAALGDAGARSHLVALSTNLKATAAFGVAPDRVFGFRDWVGGRFSLWSPVGLSIALAAGWRVFAELLAGAWEMDTHFRDAPFETSLPVLLALAGIWNIDVLGCRAHAVLAYDHRLQLLPAFLQQLEMESNGKSVGLDGAAAVHPTSPVVFGGSGTDVQHSFMQLVHQGTQIVPVDFILCAQPAHERAEAHRVLAANAFAQAEALLAGRDIDAVRAEMAAAGADAEAIARIAPHRVFSGDRPSHFILLDKLTPGRLGALIALYEHKVAVQGVIWGINSFDQWGVELGKQLCGAILPSLEAGASPPPGASSSTAALIARFRALRGEA